MSEWKMNNCPNCGGDLFVDLDIMTDNLVEMCILCGYSREAEPISYAMASSMNQGVTIEKRKRKKKRRRPQSEGWLM